MDLILHNGNFHTMDKDNPRAEAIAVLDGIIKAVGSNEEVLALKSEGTKTVDLGGKTAIPGFNDSHLHLLFYSIGLGRVDLKGSKSADEIVQRFKDFIEKNNVPEGAPVIGWGWNQDLFEGEKNNPTRYDLDKASLAHPIYASRKCGHAGCANSAMLKRFNINKDTPDVPGGGIDRDETGEPTGVFSAGAVRIFRTAQVFNAEEIKEHIMKVLPHFAQFGITSVHSDDFSDSTPYQAVYEAYIQLIKAGKLTLRVNEKCRASGLDNYKELLKLPQVEKDIAPFFKLGPVKIMADGSLGGRTAYMKEDYYDDPGNRGILVYTKEEFNAIADLIHTADRCLTVHAIGDATIQMCIDTIKRLRAESPKPHLRHSIVHCEITDIALLREFKENNVIAYVQPIFIHADWNTIAAKVGKTKAATSYAFKTLKNMGVPIPLGTDCPVDSLSPFKNIYCAVTRKDFSGNPAEGFNPNEALSVHEAVYAYTADGAYASGEESVKGMLKAGMYGDIAVLSKDIFSVPPEEILSTEADMTVFNGRIVYER